MSFNGFSDKTVNSIVKNDGFWPDIDVAVFQSTYRLPAEYEQAMVEGNILLGILWANRQLAEYKAAQIAQGFDTAEAVLGDRYDGKNTQTILYQRAVSCHAKALLLRQFATVNRREAANNEAKESEETEDKFMEFARDAIADILGISRIGVSSL